MIPDNFKTLIKKLSLKTLNKEAIWTTTSRENEFKLNFVKGAITISRFEYEFENSISIAIFNENGDKVENLLISDISKEDFSNLSELYSIITRNYFKVDETYKLIFNELDSNDIIGSDGLPF
jgi:hypothetical protein